MTLAMPVPAQIKHWTGALFTPGGVELFA